MNMMKNYYTVLEVDETASAADIKKAYRRLAQKYHPDRNQEKEADQKFKEINEANEVLSSPEKRLQYDNARKGGMGGDIGDLFESLFGGAFNGRRHRATNHRKPPTPGNAIIAIELTLDELESGNTTRVFNLQKDVVCQPCNGKGGKNITVCKVCNGTGGVTQYFKQGNMKFRSERPCSSCRGEGENITNICLICKGNGTVEERSTFNISISSHKS